MVREPNGRPPVTWDREVLRPERLDPDADDSLPLEEPELANRETRRAAKRTKRKDHK